MNRIRRIALCPAAVLALIAGTGPIAAQTGGDRRVDQFLCRDLMRESGADRDVAVAFLHGYLLGKSGGDAFNLVQLRRESDAFIERCLDHPGESALQGMIKAKEPR
jgi:hypothetical protein